jgi:hypothetical protein
MVLVAEPSRAFAVTHLLAAEGETVREIGVIAAAPEADAAARVEFVNWPATWPA